MGASLAAAKTTDTKTHRTTITVRQNRFIIPTSLNNLDVESKTYPNYPPKPAGLSHE
jgi:hypothetical protein